MPVVEEFILLRQRRQLKPAENYVQLPEETTQWDGTFTKEDYQKLVQRMYNGEYEVSSDSTTFPETEITATDYGSIK